MSMERMLEILDRTRNGPVCPTKEWELSVIPTKVSQKLKAHRLDETFTPENPINTDDELADRFFKAGFELALDIGFLCQDTERIVEFSKDEINQAIDAAPQKLSFGKESDTVVMQHRKPDDSHPMLTVSTLGQQISEEIWVPLMAAVASNRDIDMFMGGSIVTISGRPVLAGTPYETLLGRYQAQLTRDALRKAGRPGMATWAVVSSTTEYGQLGGFGIRGGFPADNSVAICLNPGELMTSYRTLHKVVHAHNCGSTIHTGHVSMIGGYAGPPEGAALAAIANSLLFLTGYQSELAGGAVIDARYGGNCGREALWANGVVLQSITRNTPLLKSSIFDSVAGPCTDVFLYELAMGALNASVSGAAWASFPRSGGGKYSDRLSPLECEFCAEIIKCSAGMSRSQINKIAKILVPKYENRLMDPPKGKGVRDCCDWKTFRPKPEWRDIYLKVKKELMDLGVPLEYP